MHIEGVLLQCYSAIMQFNNWNDLRFLLALKRGRSLSGAAQLLGVDDTTVSRRLTALQTALGLILCGRQPDGSLRLSSVGEALISHIEAMEHEVELIGEMLGSDKDSCAGTVRLTSVPIVINRLLAPEVGSLLDAHPDLGLDLIPDTRDFSLTHREADIAVRLSRPTTGGTNIKSRRIGQLHYSAYALQHHSNREAMRLPWITYDETLAHMPQAQWINRATKGRTSELVGVRVHDAETALEIVLNGLGRTLLPNVVAERHKGLQRLVMKDMPDPPTRDLWILTHVEQIKLRRIVEVTAWLENVLKPSTV
ncbi:MAG: LysR family transcriptional regulator [Gammaproteobacteria bacterium]|nr:LysR family transcriptional regulator [Gammaproteobacteria bacterium]